jgi:2-polyprenyl-3-methyl-5-hydroxy-6-metoxy-1,4-benzoquinol methylase
MSQERQFEWTPESVEAFWNFESGYPERYFTYMNAEGMLKRLRPLFAGAESILDYGCGTGLFLARLAAEGYRVAGTDTSAQSLEAAGERLQGYDTFLGVFAPDALAATGQRFDVVLATELVEHLYDDWLDQVLNSLRQLVKPTGKIIVTTPNQERLEQSLLMCPCCRSVFHRWQHVRSWSRSSLGDYVERRGFRVLEAFTSDFSKLETEQERWERSSRWKKIAKTLKGKAPKRGEQDARQPHLAMVFQPKP